MTEFGGLGLDYSYSVAVAEELGNIKCGGIPIAIGVQTDMATPALSRYSISVQFNSTVVWFMLEKMTCSLSTLLSFHSNSSTSSCLWQSDAVLLLLYG